LDNGIAAFYNIREYHSETTTETKATELIGREQMAPPPPADGPASAAPPPDGPFPSPLDSGGHLAGISNTNQPKAYLNGKGSPVFGETSGNPRGQASSNLGQPDQATIQGEPPNYFTYYHLHQYFIRDKNWMWLAATSGCWFLLDFAFYGLAIDNPRRIAAIWAPSYPNNTDFQSNVQNWPSGFDVGANTTVYSNASIPDWENPFDSQTNIYQELYGNAFRYVLTITLGSLVGSLVMVMTISKIRRKAWLVISFLILALLFIIMGGAMQTWMFSSSHPWAIAFYILCQFFFNFGKAPLPLLLYPAIFQDIT
jgi:PHS family inorganic phosphate transporter-like MFS transporter